MNARPDYANLETGEIIDVLPDGGRTPLQVARSELAAFKFSTLETVRADPRLSSAPCLAVMSVYLAFVTIDERSLKPTSAFASNITLMARACIKSKTTARAARRLLIENGYLVRIGETKDGCEKYRVENPHVERVQMHVREAEEYLKQIEAERREADRRKRKLATHRGSDIDPTHSESGNRYCTHRGSDIDPKYLRGNLGGLGSREEGHPIKVSTAPLNTYSLAKGDDRHVPYPAPTTAEELTSTLQRLFAGCQLSPEIMQAMRKMLTAGNLTPAIVEEQRRFAS